MSLDSSQQTSAVTNNSNNVADSNNNNNNISSSHHPNEHQQQEHMNTQQHHHRLQDDEEDTDSDENIIQQHQHQSAQNDTSDRVLFVFNLTVDTKEEDINREFEKYGKVEKVSIVMDRKRLINRGFCFVTMSTGEEANRALEAKVVVRGQQLTVEKAARAEGHNSTPGQGYQGKRTPRERLMPKSMRHGDKDHSRSRGGRDGGRRGGGKSSYRDSSSNSSRDRSSRGSGGGRGRNNALPGYPPHHLPPHTAGQPPYGYYDYYYGYPYALPPGGISPSIDEQHASTAGGIPPRNAATNGKDPSRQMPPGLSTPPTTGFSQPPYGTGAYPPGGYPPYSGYPPYGGYPYSYYPPYGYDYYGGPGMPGREDHEGGNNASPPQHHPGGASSRSVGGSAGNNRPSPQRGGPGRFYPSSNYRYHPYPSVSEGGVASGSSHHNAGGSDYGDSPYNAGVYGGGYPIEK
ncbi:hypothetical protein C9374_011911 [Naegleria lovaniensis]|uniref:RRM domain-containing protein n=1 Tax=Naegleria lovaniensis TaxID=51637 RepID=A0AA88G949_NAELO|nr:uncharacterized protein C9374_011911 [Naegleria lovaniensis]KAG2373622.1 hypothetical protein C9374_011911 [Naegleria lovaniensis]